MEWVPQYGIDKFKFDLLAGITIASLAIPQGISYARLANLPPIIGLYSSFVPPLLYAVFGSSNNLAVGTVAAASLLLASIIEDEVSPEDNPELYLHLFYTAAFFTGIFQTALGVFRLGLIVDFLSRSTITGFMGGTAMIIIMQQLKGLLGMKHFTSKTDLISVVGSIFKYRHEMAECNSRRMLHLVLVLQ
uniref:SLC26A/SulP transporter domain-containing protein n=1 Tax=Aegilops tauschii subsp. strangulata TaxID=200361 RepID=A0A453FI31_AEGTS